MYAKSLKLSLSKLVYEYRVHSVLFAINFMITLGFGMFNTFLPLHMIEKGLNGFTLGVIISSYSLSKLLFSSVMGFLADVGYKKILMLILLLLFIILSVACVYMDNIVYSVVLRVLQGVLFALFRPLIFSLLSESTDIKNAPSVIGTFDISFYLAVCISPFFGGFLKDAIGFAGLCYTMVCLGAISLSLIVFINSTTVFNAKHEKRRKLSKLSSLNCRLWGLFVFVMNKGFMLSVLITITPIMLSERHQLSASMIGLILSFSSFSMIAFLRFSGKLAERYNPSLLMLYGSLPVALLYFAVPNIYVGSLSLVFVLIGFFNSISHPASTRILITEGSVVGSGFVSGVCNTFMGLGFMAGPIFTSIVMKLWGVEYVFYYAGAISMVSITIFIHVYNTGNICESKELASGDC